jgi:hypothetical protein
LENVRTKQAGPDRVLGDEWLDWKGEIERHNGYLNEKKRVFFGFALLVLILLALGAVFFWYLISPRLATYHPRAPLIVGLAMAAFYFLLCLWFGLLCLSVFFERDFLVFKSGRTVDLNRLLPFVFGISGRFGISRDRMASSFIKVSNALIRATQRGIPRKKLLILLPRCLEKPQLRKIGEIAKEYGIGLSVVAGGEGARSSIAKQNPDAVIGVACERDLLSGIRDVIPKVPVIGIANIRPKGPCKDTLVDIEELERAINFFLSFGFGGNGRAVEKGVVRQ